MNPYFLFMKDAAEIRKHFNHAREVIFEDEELLKDSFDFCVRFSVLVEEYIFKAAEDFIKDCALASAGSFSRRELSPYSDIDIMFILPSIEGNEAPIKECITFLWDCGIEVSHTVRE